MIATNKMQIERIRIVRDDNIDSLLVYGTNQLTNKDRLLLLYSLQDGLERYYHLKSILDDAQILEIQQEILQFADKEVLL